MRYYYRVSHPTLTLSDQVPALIRILLAPRRSCRASHVVPRKATESSRKPEQSQGVGHRGVFRAFRARLSGQSRARMAPYANNMPRLSLPLEVDQTAA